jgi:hypothetical protein
MLVSIEFKNGETRLTTIHQLSDIDHVVRVLGYTNKFIRAINFIE